MKRDQQIFDLIDQERLRQKRGVELIASENFVSEEVLRAMGSIMTNKYAEGYPGKRYYGGCQIVDQSEQLAIDRIKKLYDAEYATCSLTPALRPICLSSRLASTPATPSWVSTSITAVT